MKLYVLSGLPGAGKSTRAREILASSNAVLVSRDELRPAIPGLNCESALTMLMGAMARTLLIMGRDVVVDAWNLHEGDEVLWRELAAETQNELIWQHLDTPVDLCVERDAHRPNCNGESRVRCAATEYAERLEKLSR